MKKFLAVGMFGVASLVTAVCVANSSEAPKATAFPPQHDAHAEHFLACAKACGECAMACDSCGAHCANLLAQGKKEHLTTLKTCQDCASLCAAAACVTARGGPFSDLICTACADACKRCGDECEKFKDDAHMKKCAEECRKCEKACRDMLKHVGHK